MDATGIFRLVIGSVSVGSFDQTNDSSNVVTLCLDYAFTSVTLSPAAPLHSKSLERVPPRRRFHNEVLQ